MKSRNCGIKKMFLFTLMIIFFLTYLSNGNKIQSKTDRQKKTFILKTKNVKYAQTNIDENKVIEDVELINLRKIKFDLQNYTMTFITDKSSREDSHKIAFQDFIIANRNFDVFFNSTNLRKVEYSKIKQHRIRKVRTVLRKIQEKILQFSNNCIYFYSNSYLNVESLPKNYYNLDLNAICFPKKYVLHQFMKNMRIFFQRFVEKKAKTTDLYMMEGLSFNHFSVAYLHNNHPNNHNGGEYSNFLESASLSYNDHGIILTDAERQNDINHILYSFNYDNIKECKYEDYKETNSKNKRMSCCFQFVYDFKDIFNNNMIICAKPHKGYRCQIKKNYIQETLTNKCLETLRKSILFVFDNQKNPKSSLIDATNYEKDFIYDKIFEIVNIKLKEIDEAPTDKLRDDIVLKMKKFLRALGREYIEYIKPYIESDYLKTLIISLNILSKEEAASLRITNGIQEEKIEIDDNHFDENGRFNSNTLNKIYRSSRVKGKTNENKNIPEYVKILGVCSKHPKFMNCLCSAFPFSPVCKNDYCKENKNSFFCNKQYCSVKKNDKENCQCSSNPMSQNCKCLIYGNFDKQCYCNKYKKSIFCQKDYCSERPSNHFFCKCEKKPNSKECRKDYCKKNRSDKRCKCLINPNSRDCVCEIVPDLKICVGKIEEIKTFYANYKPESKEKKKKIKQEEVNTNTNNE